MNKKRSDRNQDMEEVINMRSEDNDVVCSFFFFKQKTAYELLIGLVGSEMCIRDRTTRVSNPVRYPRFRASASDRSP